MACALNAIITWQTNGINADLAPCHQLLDYILLHPHAAIRYIARNMILTAQSNASYLSEHGSKSRVGNHYFLTNEKPTAPNNGTVITLPAIIWYVVPSASETKLDVLFYNCKNAMSLWQTLEEVSHHQPKTIITTNNGTTHGLSQTS